MDPTKHLANTLNNCCNYSLSSDEDKYIRVNGIEAFIYAALTRKKFRKWKIDESSQKRVREAVGLNVAAGQPIKFVFPFGGYKLWRLRSAPEVDWAEFFTLAYYIQYLSPIVTAYKPGVDLCFSSDDIIIYRMDNIAEADTDRYYSSFRKLIGCFTSSLPDNFRLSITRIGDLYPDKGVFEKELAVNIEKQQAAYDSMDPIRKEKMLKTSRLNINFTGAEDWVSLSLAQQEEKVKMGVMYHDAYGKVSRRVEFVRGKDKIVLFTTPIPDAIALGTTNNSVTKFWTGSGILEINGDQLENRIVSPSRLIEASALPHDQALCTLIPLANFKEISVFSQPLRFIDPPESSK